VNEVALRVIDYEVSKCEWFENTVRFDGAIDIYSKTGKDAPGTPGG
jgi:hypothetical protein